MMNIIGKSPQIQSISDFICVIAPDKAPVLITGESGTGKELVAKSIHLSSSRSNNSFRPVNCGAYTDELINSELFGHEKGSFTGAIKSKKGEFELAENGTLFLDEICDTSPAFQVKLLRVLQEKKYKRVGGDKEIQTDVRIISATNKNPEEEMLSGRFRKDLYYRLDIHQIEMPPLRERVSDISELVSHFIAKHSDKDISISREALNLLQNYEWPGNIRELENVVQRILPFCQNSEINSTHIKSYGRISNQSPTLPFKPEELVEVFRDQSRVNERPHVLLDFIKRNPTYCSTSYLEKTSHISAHKVRRTVEKNRELLSFAVCKNGRIIKSNAKNCFIVPTEFLECKAISLQMQCKS